jgi:hypothetical protein
MSDPLKTTLRRALTLTGALALTFSLFAVSAPAGAAPLQARDGVTAPNLQVEDVGYKRGKKYRQLYGSDYYVSDYYANGSPNRVYRDIPGGNNEIRELQRLFPETNWPPSLRY